MEGLWRWDSIGDICRRSGPLARERGGPGCLGESELYVGRGLLGRPGQREERGLLGEPVRLDGRKRARRGERLGFVPLALVLSLRR